MKLTKRDLALLAVIVYFTFIGGTFYSQLNFPLRVANQIIGTGLLGGWLITRLRKKEGLPQTYLDLALALYFLANLLSALLGQSPRFSLEQMWFSLVHLLAFYWLVDFMRRGWTPKLTWAFYMASAVVCLVGLIEFMAWYVGTPLFSNFWQGWLELGGWRHPIPPSLYRLNITLNGSTPLAAYLAVLIPPAIALVISLPRRNQNRQALIFWLVLAFIVEILTFSRAGILALSISLPLTFIGWLKVTEWGWPDVSAWWSRLGRWQRTIISLAILVMVGIGLFWLYNSFVQRGLRSTEFRFTLWQAAIAIFKADFLTGAGPANFGRALLRLNDAAFPRLQIATAHNIYLNTAAELGLIGLAVGGYLLLRLAAAWRRRWQQLSRPADRLRLIACGAALTGLAGQTVVDTYPATPNMLVMLALVAYIVGDLKTAPAAGDIHSSRLPRKYSKLLGRYDFRILWPKLSDRPLSASLALAALLVYALGFSWLALADSHFQNSFREEGRGNLPQAIAQARQAQALDPTLPLRTFRLALLEARLAAQTDDPDLIQAAVEHYQAGLQQEPILGLNSANLAGLLWQQGQRAEAIDVLRRTITAEEAPLYLINLGYFYEQEGDWVQAGAAYGRALFLAPDLAASGFWQASPARARRWPDFVQAASEQLSPHEAPVRQLLRLDLALAREDFDTAAALLEPEASKTAEPLRPALAELYLSQGQAGQAEALLEPDPQAAQDYFLWGRLKLQLGETAAAEKLLKTAIFLGDSEAYYYLGRLFEQQGDLPAAETAYRRGYSPHATSENIAVTIYGRIGANDLAPQLLRIRGGLRQARAWLALARLYEQQQRSAEAGQIYQILLAEDPFLEIDQEGQGVSGNW